MPQSGRRGQEWQHGQIHHRDEVHRPVPGAGNCFCYDPWAWGQHQPPLDPWRKRGCQWRCINRQLRTLLGLVPHSFPRMRGAPIQWCPSVSRAGDQRLKNSRSLGVKPHAMRSALIDGFKLTSRRCRCPPAHRWDRRRAGRIPRNPPGRLASRWSATDNRTRFASRCRPQPWPPARVRR